ncbi:MAG: hybrid sensor histidine kinase/response regulator [Magnetococcales bacterium]|nr:hybrid sensor histidine kinase/response regulator [Magnetococcales bacterium]
MGRQRATIMIVDDERLNINLLNNMLKDRYTIKVALNGEQALERALSAPRPDMVLLDIKMPGMDGYEVCKRLKANPETDDIPIIFITALSQDEDEKKGLELGAVDYIAKPLRPPIILERIKTHLGLKHMRMALAARNAELEKMLKLRETMDHLSRHDLKSPLNGILGVHDILSEADYLQPQHKRLLEILENSGLKMLEMINRSLDMMKIETGSYVLQPNPVELIGMFKRIWGDINRHVRTKNIALKIILNGKDITATDKFIVSGEELLCYSMFSNLLKNAGEAVSNGQTVTIFLENGDQPTIKLHNPGEVPPQIKNNFFKKYTTAGKLSGSGLGTYSAKLNAQAMGGKIAMHSSAADGTTIIVTLPAPSPTSK